MNIKELKKEIKGVFVQPKKVYYLGKIKHGTPYFYPINFNKNILSVKRIYLKTKKELNKTPEHLRGKTTKYKLPMVRRSKYWVVEIFNRAYYIEVGYPIRIHYTKLGWKTKWDSVRFEWCPQFSIFFFHWQFCIHWIAPDGNNDLYYEMILYYLHKANKNVKKAKKTWNWVDYDTNKSTWDDKYLKQ